MGREGARKEVTYKMGYSLGDLTTTFPLLPSIREMLKFAPKT